MIYLSASRLTAKYGEFPLGTFMARRIARLYPPLILSVFITLLLYSLAKFLDLEALRQIAVGSETVARSHLYILPENLAGACLFLNGLVDPFKTPAMNRPLWSLSHEFWFYLIFGVAVTSLSSRKMLLWLAVILVALSFRRSIVLILLGMFVWSLGCLLAWAYQHQHLSRRRVVIGSAIGFCLTLPLCWTGHFLDLPYGINHVFKYLAGFPTFFGIALLISTDFTGRGRLWFWIRDSAGFSYTLYVIHFPILLFIQALVHRHILGRPFLIFLTCVLSGALCIYISKVCAEWVENKERTRRVLHALQGETR